MFEIFLNEWKRSYPFCILQLLILKMTYPHQQPGGAKKSFIQGAPPEVQILALFLYILNTQINRKGYLLKNDWMSFIFFTVPLAFILRCSEPGWEVPINTVIKKSFWPSRCWSQMMWEALAFFKLLHKCSSKFGAFLRENTQQLIGGFRVFIAMTNARIPPNPQRVVDTMSEW